VPTDYSLRLAPSLPPQSTVCQFEAAHLSLRAANARIYCPQTSHRPQQIVFPPGLSQEIGFALAAKVDLPTLLLRITEVRQKYKKYYHACFYRQNCKIAIK
jgi:hypothetical protein